MLFVLFSQRDYLSLVYHINYINSYHHTLKSPNVMNVSICRSIVCKHFILFFDISEFVIFDASKCVWICVYSLLNYMIRLVVSAKYFSHHAEILSTASHQILAICDLIKHTRCERAMKSWIMMFIISKDTHVAKHLLISIYRLVLILCYIHQLLCIQTLNWQTHSHWRFKSDIFFRKVLRARVSFSRYSPSIVIARCTRKSF